MLLSIVPYGEQVKIQETEGTNTVKYKMYLVKSKEKICTYYMLEEQRWCSKNSDELCGKKIWPGAVDNTHFILKKKKITPVLS